MLLRDGVNILTIMEGSPMENEINTEGDRLALTSIIKDHIQDFDDLLLKDADLIYSVAVYVTRYIECNSFGESSKHAQLRESGPLSF